MTNLRLWELELQANAHSLVGGVGGGIEAERAEGRKTYEAAEVRGSGAEEGWEESVDSRSGKAFFLNRKVKRWSWMENARRRGGGRCGGGGGDDGGGGGGGGIEAEGVEGRKTYEAVDRILRISDAFRTGGAEGRGNKGGGGVSSWHIVTFPQRVAGSMECPALAPRLVTRQDDAEKEMEEAEEAEEAGLFKVAPESPFFCSSQYIREAGAWESYESLLRVC